jgi:ribosome-binding ATPase YchF (GTP1/OBG family)
MVAKRIEKIEQQRKKAQQNAAEKKLLDAELELLLQIQKALDTSNAPLVNTLYNNAKVATIPLLSAKNFLIIANVSEQELENEAYTQNAPYQALVTHFGKERVVPVCARVERELSQLPEAEAQELMTMLGIKEKSLDTIIRKTYDHLGLITFFTCGPKEAHAWPIKRGSTIKQAAGEIHSDLERGFICAEIFNSADLLALGALSKVKESGKMRTEGAEYLVQDGDIVLIKFNV